MKIGKVVVINVLVLGILFAILEVGARYLDRRMPLELPPAPETADAFGTFQSFLDYAKQLGSVQEQMTGGGGIDYEPYTVITLKPNFKFKIKNIDYTTNSLGFRSREVVAPKAKRTKRIVILGGSTVQGGLNQQWTISHYLESALRKKNPNVEVVNAGILGFSSSTELSLMINKVLDLEPDLVLVFDGRNDVFYASLPDWVKRKGPDYVEHKQALDTLVNHPTAGSLLTYQLKFLAKQSAFVTRLFRMIFRREVANTYPKVIKVREEGISTYLENLALMKAVLESRKIPGIFAFQPTLGYCKPNLSAYEKTIIGYLNEVERTDWMKQIGVIWPAVARRHAAMPGSTAVGFHDLSCLFERNIETAYVDSVHYSPVGYRMIGERLADIVVRDHAVLLAEPN